jgi:hypothetical protein
VSRDEGPDQTGENRGNGPENKFSVSCQGGTFGMNAESAGLIPYFIPSILFILSIHEKQKSRTGLTG